MKSNKVLVVIYGIALFIALLIVVELLYNAIEMLSYTTFYESFKITDGYSDFQKPIAIALLVASICGIIGIVAGVVYLFVKKPLFRILCFVCVAIAVAAVLAALIVVCEMWNKYYINGWKYYAELNPHSISSEAASEFAVYSASLILVIQNLVCFATIAAVLVYDFVKGIKDKKKEAAVQEVAAEEITE